MSDVALHVKSAIETHLAAWLEQQRWVSKSEHTFDDIRIVQSEMLLASGTPTDVRSVWTLIATGDGAHYQALFGIRPTNALGGVLLGYPRAHVCEFDEDGTHFTAYDALVDKDLDCALLSHISQGSLQATSARILGAEQSNTSLVFDNRYIVKIFRRMYGGINPDVEVTTALTASQYPHIASVLAAWRKDNMDLAVCQPFLWDGVDGWRFALSSVRDALATELVRSTYGAGHAITSGADFAQESRRIGEMTGLLHVHLSHCFPCDDFDASHLLHSLRESANQLPAHQRAGLEQIITKLASLPDGALGRAVRVHGDYHLGQTMRSVSGWHMFDFEGEPARPIAERTLLTSTYKDVAGMARSFQYAAATGLFAHVEADRAVLSSAADEWEARNRAAFLAGVSSVDGIDELLPTSAEARDALLRAFEAEKALYELAYEKAYRPAWVRIPETALERLLSA